MKVPTPAYRCALARLQPDPRPGSIDQRPPFPAADEAEAELRVELDAPIQVGDEELDAGQQVRPLRRGHRSVSPAG